jgi:hypothetical protein
MHAFAPSTNRQENESGSRWRTSTSCWRQLPACTRLSGTAVRLNHSVIASACLPEAMAARRERASLKSLTADDLWAVMSNVPSTAGTVSDVLYFSPRLLEHAATEDCIVDLSWAFSSLQRADAPQTTGAERTALRRFFEPIWLGLRDSDSQSTLGISDIVLPTAVLTDEISHYLDLWIGSHALHVYRSRSADAFWYEGSKAHNAVLQWLKEH